MAALARAQSLREVLTTPILTTCEVLAGHAGLDRRVERLNVMEVPDILPWVKPAEFLLTTAYPLREHPEELSGLVADLDGAGLAGLGIKLGRYLDAVPPAVLEVAERREFPVVRLPDQVSFDDVFNQVLTRMLNQQAEQLARSERMHHTFLDLVLHGQGLDEIAAELADLLDGPAAILDRDGAVLAAARLGEIPGVGGGAVDAIDLDPDVGTAELGGAVVGYRAAPISAGTHLHGRVVALAGDDRLPDDRLVLENAATTAALSLAKQKELEAVEAKYQSDLVHDLLTGRTAGAQDPCERARMFGWDLDRPLVVVVLELDEPPGPVAPDPDHPGRPLAAGVRQTVRTRDPGAAVVRFSDEVVVLTGAFDDGRDGVRGFADRLGDVAAERIRAPVSIGVSRPAAGVGDIPASYEQATAAVAIGRRIHGGGAVAHFDDLGVHRVLHLIDEPRELRAFAEETLGWLAGDDEEAVDLRETLRVLLQANCNVAEAARRLHFHYNTLRYRIDKLEDVVGPFVDDARVRLDVHVALLILGMHGLDGAGNFARPSGRS